MSLPQRESCNGHAATYWPTFAARANCAVADDARDVSSQLVLVPTHGNWNDPNGAGQLDWEVTPCVVSV